MAKSLEEKKRDSLRFVNHAFEIAALIEKHINDRGWSNAKFAEVVGVNSTEVSKWLGGNQNFTLRTISKIENALDLDIVKKFSDEELGLTEVIVESNVSEAIPASELTNVSHLREITIDIYSNESYSSTLVDSEGPEEFEYARTA